MFTLIYGLTSEETTCKQCKNCWIQNSKKIVYCHNIHKNQYTELTFSRVTHRYNQVVLSYILNY